METLMVEHHKT